MPGAATARLDVIDNQQGPEFLAQMGEAFQPRAGSGGQAAFSLNQFDQNGGGALNTGSRPGKHRLDVVHGIDV